MRHQASRTIAVMLGVLLVTAAPAQAGTITFRDLVRSVGASGQLRSASEVRLRLGAQSGAVQTQSTPAQGGATTTSEQQAGGAQSSGQSGSTVTTQTPGDQTLSQSGGRVETVDLGDVTGTVCDCGIIPPSSIPKAGFPWWPLLGGALVPFLIPRGGEEPVPPLPPPPTPPQIPEPMSLLLFGSGLLAIGAGARRRHGRKQLTEGAAVAATEEV